MGNLKGKVAVCTGAGRDGGLGAGILRRLAADGCKVVVSDIGAPTGHMSAGHIGTTDDMDAVVASIREDGGEAMAIACNVMEEGQVRALVDGTVAAYGRLDIFVNNAGIGYIMKSLHDCSLAEWNSVLGVNLTGAFLCTKYAVDAMIKAGRGGRIINIASQAAKSGFPHMAAYVASKHGLVGLTRSNAVELGSHGITVNAICPNHVTTGLGADQNAYFAAFKGMSVDAYLEDMKKRIPMGRAGLVTDTAAACAFLASDDAQFITGEAMNVSGGEEMH